MLINVWWLVVIAPLCLIIGVLIGAIITINKYKKEISKLENLIKKSQNSNKELPTKSEDIMETIRKMMSQRR